MLQENRVAKSASQPSSEAQQIIAALERLQIISDDSKRLSSVIKGELIGREDCKLSQCPTEDFTDQALLLRMLRNIHEIIVKIEQTNENLCQVRDSILV